MITLHGTGICKGVGMAEAVVVEAGRPDAIPEDLIRRGIQAIRRGEAQAELPAIVVVCESLSAGAAFKLPGLRIVGMAADSDGDSPTPCETPSVAGVEDLLRSVASGDIVVVDGTRGVVYIDPDAHTLMEYQSMEGHEKKRRIFLGSAHLPAMTQGGRAVLTLALIEQAADSGAALEEGADGLLLTTDAVGQLAEDDWTRLIDESGGKPIMLLSPPEAGAFRDLMAQAVPLQVTVAAPVGQEFHLVELRESADAICRELAEEGTEPAEIALGVLVDAASEYEDGYLKVPASRLIVDARGCESRMTQSELAGCIFDAVSASGAVDDNTQAEDETVQTGVPTTVLLGSSIDAVRYLATASVDSVAVPVGLVAATKDLIRSIPTEE